MINDELRKYRKDNKLTQKQVADILNIDRSTYAYYENGKHRPSISILSKLARIYDVPVDYLLGNTDSYNSYNKVMEDDSTFYNKDEKKEELKYLSEIGVAEQEALLLFRLLEDKQAALRALKELSEKEDESALKEK